MYPYFPQVEWKHQDLALRQKNVWGSQQALRLAVHTLSLHNGYRLPWMELFCLLWLIQKERRAHSWHWKPLNTPSMKQMSFYTHTNISSYPSHFPIHENRHFPFNTDCMRKRLSLLLRHEAIPILTTLVWCYQEEFWNNSAWFGKQTHSFHSAGCFLVLFLWIWMHNYLTTED